MNSRSSMIPILVLLSAASGCFLIEGLADTVTTSAGTGGSDEIPNAYASYFIGESRIYSSAPVMCEGPDITISLGRKLEDKLASLNDTGKSIAFGDGYKWQGVIHCDPAADASCSNVEHSVSDWADAQGFGAFIPQQRDDAMFADAATLSVFVGNGVIAGEHFEFTENVPEDDSGATCSVFFSNGVALNASSRGPQGANGIAIVAPCYGKPRLWGAPVDAELDTDYGVPSSDLVGTSHPNRLYLFGGSALMLAEDALAVWWDGLLTPGQFGWNAAEDWHWWHTALNQQGNAYSNLPAVATFRHQGETLAELEDRSTLSNLRTGYRYENNPEPKDTSTIVTDWVYYTAPTLCTGG